MVSIKTFFASSVALIVAFANVEAAVSPTYPSPGTIQIEGQSYDITWTFDGKDPKTTYTIGTHNIHASGHIELILTTKF
ncbi:hypothetical protein PS6_005922 [Mucor atramentarius]